VGTYQAADRFTVIYRVNDWLLLLRRLELVRDLGRLWWVALTDKTHNRLSLACVFMMHRVDYWFDGRMLHFTEAGESTSSTAVAHETSD